MQKDIKIEVKLFVRFPFVVILLNLNLKTIRSGNLSPSMKAEKFFSMGILTTLCVDALSTWWEKKEQDSGSKKELSSKIISGRGEAVKFRPLRSEWGDTELALVANI